MKGIKNIIFDLGGVLLDLEVGRTIRELEKLGLNGLDDYKITRVRYPFFEAFETGRITAGQFRDEIRGIIGRDDIQDRQVDYAWTAMIVGLRKEKIEFLPALKKKYRTFLLSNTNILHEHHYHNMLKETIGKEHFLSLFEKVYYSHRVGMRKPDPAIFRHVLEDACLVPGETLYIDDFPEHVKTAEELGIRIYKHEQNAPLDGFLKLIDF